MNYFINQLDFLYAKSSHESPNFWKIGGNYFQFLDTNKQAIF